MREAFTGLALFMLMIFVVLIAVIVVYDNNFKQLEEQVCNCTVNIGNQTLTIEDAFEYVTKGLSDHQWLEVQQAINQSCGEP